MSFLGLFVVETSRGFEAAYADVDDVYLHGEAQVVPFNPEQEKPAKPTSEALIP